MRLVAVHILACDDKRHAKRPQMWFTAQRFVQTTRKSVHVAAHGTDWNNGSIVLLSMWENGRPKRISPMIHTHHITRTKFNFIGFVLTILRTNYVISTAKHMIMYALLTLYYVWVLVAHARVFSCSRISNNGTSLLWRCTAKRLSTTKVFPLFFNSKLIRINCINCI